MDTAKHKLWMEKYRPKRINEYVFHDDSQRASVERMVADASIPHLLLSGVQGSGKAQPLYAKVLTPTGWKKMGDLTVGEMVITPSGEAAPISMIFPQGKKDIYTITFHDGSTTECCLDHLWECYFVDDYKDRKAKKHVVDTRTILRFVEKQSQRQSESFKVSIPLISSIPYPNKSYLVDPYLLGVLLGDGSFRGNGIRITSTDEEVIDECKRLLPEGYTLKLFKNTSIEYSLINENREVYGGRRGTQENTIKGYLRAVGLDEIRSHEKFVPEEYMVGSVDQRWALLQGLMDTDGTVGERGNASFSTTSHKLAKQVQQLSWSLGCTCSMRTRVTKYKYSGVVKEGKLSFTLHLNHKNGTGQMFRLRRKQERGSISFAKNHNKGDVDLRRRIVSIKYKGIEEAQCILLDDPNHLYITDDYIVTHNTTLALVLITELGIEPSDVLTINASDENSVDVMRDKIKSFVSTFAMGDFKIVHLEEADYITPNGQAVLRRMMEEYADTARFILTCNYENKIIPAIKSRCQHFRFSKHDIDEVTGFVANVLVKEKVKFKLDLLDKYVRVGYPDIRKIINLLQQNSHKGRLMPLESGGESGDYKFQLLDLIANDDWFGARKITCGEVAAEEWEDVFRFLYENLHKAPKYSNQSKWEEGIVIIADHLYKHSLCADAEINAAAMYIRLSQI